MKLLINAFSARLGGGKTYLVNLLRELPDVPGLQIIIYSPESLDLVADPRIERRYIAAMENPIRRLWWERCKLPGILRRESIDVLFCPGGLINTQLPNGCRAVTMFRNMLPFDPAALQALPWGPQRVRLHLLRAAMLRSMRGADLVIFISHFARGVIEARIPVRRAVTIPHGVPEVFKTHGEFIPRPEYIPEGEYILYVSRFEPYKHHLEVVRGYASLPEEVRARFRLVLIGEKMHPQSTHVEQEIMRCGLTDSVHVVGGVDYKSLPGAYRNASMVLFASSCENCPNILLEALGAGRPMLVSNVEPMPEFAADAAMYFAPTSPNSIAQSILQVASDRALARRLAENAARRSEDFTWAQTAHATWREILRT